MVRPLPERANGRCCVIRFGWASIGAGSKRDEGRACCQERTKPLQTSTSPCPSRRPPASSVGSPACGDYRRCTASCRNLRRFACGICAGWREAGGRLRQARQQNMLIYRYFTGATGLEPATSGVTGRSWRFRAERGQAGIPGHSRDFRPDVAGIGGCRRELPGASCGISAGCGVAQSANGAGCARDAMRRLRVEGVARAYVRARGGTRPVGRAVNVADLSRLASRLEGVTERTWYGVLDWRYRGRRVAH